MGLIIKATENLPIRLWGTDIFLDSVYARLRFISYPDGLTIEVGIDLYLSKEKFDEGVKVSCSVHDGSFFAQIDVANETQSLETAHTYAIAHFERLGYQCEFI
jgi:hypothetical protein